MVDQGEPQPEPNWDQIIEEVREERLGSVLKGIDRQGLSIPAF
jgi:hypothetical protein